MIKVSLEELYTQYIKDGTECIDDYFPYRKERSCYQKEL
jgi:hypothetical protein